MKIHNVESVNMVEDQQAIAERVMELVRGRDFAGTTDFDDIEGELITQACKDLGWESAPQNGGLIVIWEG